MTESLVLNSEKRSLFDQLISELKYALKDLTTEELLSIFADSASKSIEITYNNKKASLQRVIKFSKETFNRYKTEGIVNSAKYDAEKAGSFILSLPKKAKGVYNNFLNLSHEEQIEVVAVTILTLAIFYTVSGGSDLEGGLPDMDIAVAGIGHHRSIFSHSILIGFGVEFTGRFSILVIQKIKNRLPVDHHKVWDSVYGFIDKNKELAIAAMWLGIGTHLLKDSGIFDGGVKPYADLSVSMPMEAHQGLFAINGIASGIFSTKNLG